MQCAQPHCVVCHHLDSQLWWKQTQLSSSWTLWSAMCLLRSPGVWTFSLFGTRNSSKSESDTNSILLHHLITLVRSQTRSGVEVESGTLKTENLHYWYVYEATIQVCFKKWKRKIRSIFAQNLQSPAGTRRSEPERSCLNTGNGCNGILSLNDVQWGRRVITSSQPVYQSERGRDREEEEKGGCWRENSILTATNFWNLNMMAVK